MGTLCQAVKLAMFIALSLLRVQFSVTSTVFQRVVCEEDLFRHLFLSQSSNTLSTFPLCLLADEVDDGEQVVEVQELNITQSEFEGLLRARGVASLKYEVSVTVLQLLGVSEKDQTVTVALRIKLRWNDCRLAWSRPNFHMVDNITIPASRFASLDIFVPTTILLEETSATASSGSEMQVAVNWTGGVVLTKQYTTSISCNFDLRMYPFDSHMCTLTFETPFNSQELNMTYWLWETEAESRFLLGDGHFIPSDTWEVIVFPPKKNRTWICAHSKPSGPEKDQLQCYQDRQTFRMLLSRHSAYQVINLLIPAFLCLLVAASIFIIAPGQTDKVFLQLAILTSMFMFMNMMYSKMPESGSTLPWISQYYLISIVMLCANCIFAAITTTIAAVDFKVPSSLRKFVLACHPIMLDMIPRRKSKSKPTPKSDVTEETTPNDGQKELVTWRLVGTCIDRLHFCFQFVFSIVMVIVFVAVGYYPPSGPYGGLVSKEDWPYIHTQLALQGDHYENRDVTYGSVDV